MKLKNKEDALQAWRLFDNSHGRGGIGGGAHEPFEEGTINE